MQVANNKILQLTDDSFDGNLLSEKRPVLVSFWAEWNGDCKMMLPILEEIAKEYEDKLTVGELNIDMNASSPHKFGIRSIPTLLLFKDGEVVATQSGALSKPQLKEVLDANL